MIYYRSDHTGGAWWPWDYSKDYTFENNTQYKIYGEVFVANTGTFREAWEVAIKLEIWRKISCDK